MPLTLEAKAQRGIHSSPGAYCNATSRELLTRILPGFDQETQDFFRWEAVYGAAELGEIILSRLGMDVGSVVDLEPLERGCSGRIIRLRVTGERLTLAIEKKLEIRRSTYRSPHYRARARAVRHT